MEVIVLKKVLLLVFIATMLLISSAFADSVKTPDEYIETYVKCINNQNWEEYVELFDFTDEVKNDLLEFLTDKNHIQAKNGVLSVQRMKLVSAKPLENSQFAHENQFAYEALTEIKVYKGKESEFYKNGIAKQIFVFNNHDDGSVTLETIYLNGFVRELGQDSLEITPRYEPVMDPEPDSLPTTIKLYDTTDNQLKILYLDAYLKDVLPNEIIASLFHTEAIKANVLAAKTYAWYNIQNPREPAKSLGAHVTDQHEYYQQYVDGSDYYRTNDIIDSLSDDGMIKELSPFDAQYRAGTQGEIGIQNSGVMKQWGSHELATNYGYNYIDILEFYYTTDIIIVDYLPYPTPLN